jgi:hypothetical protein
VISLYIFQTWICNKHLIRIPIEQGNAEEARIKISIEVETKRTAEPVNKEKQVFLENPYWWENAPIFSHIIGYSFAMVLT